MKITCWGSRGSIPVSGPEYDAYGGDTPCLEIRSRNDELLVIDCGTGARRLGKLLLAERRKKMNVIFTHAHWDHVIGFPFFRPIYTQGTTIFFHGCPFTQSSISQILAKTMEAPFFPVPFEEVAADFVFTDTCHGDFCIDTITIQPIFLSHPNEGLGYKFVENGRSFVYLTDNELGYRHPGGLSFEEYREFSAGADLLIHDAEFTEEEYLRNRTWGHSSYREALRLALEAGVRRFGLFHHNQDRTDLQIEEIVADCRRIIAGRESSMECFAVAQDAVFEV